MRRKKISPARIARTIDEVTGFVVELWPIAQPRCFVQADDINSADAVTKRALDYEMPLRFARFFATGAEALVAAAQAEEVHEPGSSINPTLRRARRTNSGAQGLLMYRQFAEHTLHSLATELNVGPRYAHDLCWGLTLPSLPVAGTIRSLTSTPLEAWLRPTITLAFPEFAQ